MRNKTNSKYLHDAIKQTGMDYDEAVEAIEREKKIMRVSSSSTFIMSTKADSSPETAQTKAS